MNVAPAICRLVFSYAVPSRKTPGSMPTVFACKYRDRIVDGMTAVIDVALSSNSTFSATPESLRCCRNAPWHIHALSWIPLALGQQLPLWIGLRLQADLRSWGLNWQLLLDTSLEQNLLYKVPSLSWLRSHLSTSSSWTSPFWARRWVTCRTRGCGASLDVAFLANQPWESLVIICSKRNRHWGLMSWDCHMQSASAWFVVLWSVSVFGAMLNITDNVNC